MKFLKVAFTSKKVYLLRSRIPNSLFVSLILQAFQCGSHYLCGLSWRSEFPHWLLVILIREVSQSCIHFYKVYLLSRIPNSLFVSLILQAFQFGSHYLWGLSCKVRVSTLTIGDLGPWSLSKLHSLLQILQSLSFIQDSKFTICQFDPSSFSMWQSLFVRFIL